MMRALGAEVILVDQVRGAQQGQVSGADLAKVEERAEKLVAERNGFRADQFHHPANRGAHLTTTGPELWQQSGGQLDAFVDFVGAGGTYAGTIQALKAFNPACKGYVVEPDGAAVLSGQGATQPQHPIQGGGYGMKQLAALASGDIDGYLTISGNDAKDATRDLARLEVVQFSMRVGKLRFLVMRPSSAKAKGRRLQQRVASDLCDAFDLDADDCRSCPMGSHGEDVQLSAAARAKVPWSIECKNHERLNVWQAMAQAEAHCAADANVTPIVVANSTPQRKRKIEYPPPSPSSPPESERGHGRGATRGGRTRACGVRGYDA